MACAMPQAMERSVARPTISARLPIKKPILFSRRYAPKLTGSRRPRMIGCSLREHDPEPSRALVPLFKAVSGLALLPVRIDVHDQMLPGPDLMMPVKAVPGFELRDRNLNLPRKAQDGVANTHVVHNPAPRPPSLAPYTPS